MNWTLLHKYLSQECDSAEKQAMEQWLKADPQHQQLMDSVEKIWKVTPEDELQVDAQAAWASFRRRVLEKQGAIMEDLPLTDLSSSSKNRKHKVWPKRRYTREFAYSLAAAAVLLVAFLFYNYAPSLIENSQTQPERAMQEIVTDRGQRTAFRLSDGSHVQLNADSRLEIPGKFMEDSREVYLAGEAYFEVTHNPDIPFVVHTKNASTKVLGTKFGVNAYPDEDQVQVVVSEGKVALSPSKQTVSQSREITRNEIGTLLKTGEASVTHTNEIERYLGWKDGQLVFRDAPFGEVERRLERWYDIEIMLKDSTLASRPLTASFKDEPMMEVLNVIALSLEVTYKRAGRTFIFQKN